MTSLGETLRRERLKRNLELNRIADELKISASMLKAIEDERFDKLPGGVFARSFVRQYARVLGLDEEEIVDELRRVLSPEPETPPLPQAHAAPESEIPLPRVTGWQAVNDQPVRWSSSPWVLGGAVAVLVIGAAAYAWWQRERRPEAARQNAPAAENAAPAPAPAVEPPVPAAEAKTPEAVSAPPAAQPPPPAEPQAAPAEPPAADDKAVKPAAPAADAGGNGAAAPLPPPSPPAAEANPDAAVRVEIVAEEQTWVSIRTDGQPSFTGVLDAAQSRTVAANRTVWLKVGNAAGVNVRLNGKPIGPLGEKGVVRTLQLTSGGFKILPPDLPKPAPAADSPNPF